MRGKPDLLLKSLLLCAGLFLAAPAFAASATFTIHGGVIQGAAQAGPARMAGSIPVARNLRNWAGRHGYSSRAYNSRYYSNRFRFRRNDPYANLNQ